MSDTIASDDKTQIGTVNPATETIVNRARRVHETRKRFGYELLRG